MLRAHGHSEVMQYTPGLIHEEGLLIRSWMDQQEATRAILLQAAVGSLLDKQGAKTFKEVTSRMMEG